MLKETWSRWHITEIKFGAVVFHHILHAVVCHGCSIRLTRRPASSTTAAPAGTGSTPWTSWATTGPSCATRRTGTPARADESTHYEGLEEESLYGTRLPAEESTSAGRPSVRGHHGTPPGTGDITVEMFTFALATFLLFTVALCTVTLLGETRGPSHLCIFPD